MTYKEFLEALKKFKWSKEDGPIRMCEKGWCPLLAVYHDRKGPDDPNYTNSQPSLAAAWLGLPENLADDIISAADNRFVDVAFCANIVRNDLLVACSL